MSEERKLRKLKDQAAKFSEKGKHRKALDAYIKVSSAEPDKPRWMLKIAELHRRLGQKPQAVTAFVNAAQHYAESGFLLKAVAMCNQILSLDPDHKTTQSMLASYYSSRFGPPAPTVVADAAPVASATLPAPVAAPVPPAPALIRKSIEPIEIEITDDTPPMEMTPLLPSEQALANAPTPVGEEILEIEVGRDDQTQPEQGGLLTLPTMDAIPLDETGDLPATDSAGRRPTIPPGACLDAVRLGEIMVEAVPHDTMSGSPLMAIEIPLDEQLEEAFDSAFMEVPTAITPDVPKVPLFSSLDKISLQTLIERVEIKKFDAGTRIITQGDPGSSLYVVVDGQVTIFSEGPPRTELTRLEEDSFFGEIALLTASTRTCTVEAAVDTTVIEISKEVIGDLIDEHAGVLKVLLKFFRYRLINSLIETSELFAPFSDDQREELASAFKFIEAEQGTIFIQEGKRSDGLYILLSGSLEVTQQDVTDSRWADLGPQDLFGAASLISGAEDPVTIEARTKCWLLKLDRATFREVIMTHPQVLEFVSELAEKRLEPVDAPEEEDEGLVGVSTCSEIRIDMI